MKRSALFTLALAAVAGAAAASTPLPPIQVSSAQHADRGTFLACEGTQIKQVQLQRLFGPHQPSESRSLRRQLTAAVLEACAQRVPRIVVERNGAEVLWAPAPVEDFVAQR
ncbi:MAG: hypothetical protein ACK5VV_09195 [Lysobacteraceae bacterium]